MRYVVRRPETFIEKFFNEFDTPAMNLGNNVDIYREDNSYVVEIDMAGFEKSDINIDFNDDILSIEAKHEEIENDTKDYVYRSRKVKEYARQIRFSNIDQDGIDANYTDGVLTIKLPRVVEEAPVAKRIELK